MASSTPFDGKNFLTAAPDEDQPHGNDYQEHQSTRKSMEFVNNKEHDAIANDPSAADGGGEHSAGSAKIYYGDYSTSSAGDALPSVRPDGVTALDSSDAGRLAFDTDATYGGIVYEWSGSAWAATPYTYDTATTLAGKSWFLDEDDMASDDDTKVASQQSIKAYVDDGGAKVITDDVTGASSVQVSTKYFTGTLAAGADTNVAHGITGVDNILSVTVSVFNVGSSVYFIQDNRGVATAAAAWLVSYDGTNVIFAVVGSSSQSQKYRIRIDYI